MASTEKTTGSPGKMVTPHDGVRCILPSLTFGSFLPPKFWSILEEVEDSILEEDLPTSIHLRTFGTSSPNRRLQFFEVTIATIPPVPKKEFAESMKIGQGKSLSYVPPTPKEGKNYVNISEEDLHE